MTDDVWGQMGDVLFFFVSSLSWALSAQLEA